MAQVKPAAGKARVARPLSPHLQIFRLMINMVMSMMHRLTGLALYVGMLFVVWWLIAAASGPDAYDLFRSVAGTWFGLLVIVGFVWALLHHLLGGLRHLVWDLGHGLTPAVADTLSWGTLVGSLGLTVLFVVVLMSGA